MRNQIWTLDEQGFHFPGRNEAAPEGELLIYCQILESLLDEGKALQQDDLITISHNIASTLEFEDRVELQLPEAYPFGIEIMAEGHLASRDLQYRYQFTKGPGTPFVNPRRIGSFLQITQDQTYLLTGDQYRVVCLLEEFNQSQEAGASTGYIKNNLLYFAQIKGLTKRTAAQLDTFLASQDVFLPDSLSIRLQRLADGSLEIVPVLGLSTDTADQKQREEVNQRFATLFAQSDRIRDMYPLPDGRRLVLKEIHHQALGQAKSIGRLSGEKKDAFLKAPQEFLNGDVFDLTAFAERVVEIGEYKPRVFPFLRPVKEAWLPPEGGLTLDGETLVISPEKIATVKQALTTAMAAGSTSITVDDRPIPATPEVLDAVNQLEQAGYTKGMTSGDALADCGSQTRDRRILIIRDNIVETDFNSAINPRGANPGMPRSLNAGIELLAHQKEGLGWLQYCWNQGYHGGILADDMGLGKTLQALSFMAWVRELMDKGLSPKKPMLLVAPVVLLNNWKDEYDRFLSPASFGPMWELHGAGLNSMRVRAADRRFGNQLNGDNLASNHSGLLFEPDELAQAGIVLTTYETLRDHQLSFGRVEWSVMVLDEAQKIKTPTAMMTMAAKAMKYEFGLCLTGTPVENSWVDLWSLMDFVQPGKLGSLKEFNRLFQAPLRHTDTDRQALGAELKAQLGGHLMRRMKQDKLPGLPEKHIVPCEEPMPAEQLAVYLDVVQRARRQLLPDMSGSNQKQHIFQIISALRDISLHPYLLTCSESTLAQYPVEAVVNASARLKAAIRILHGVRERNEKAIVFVLNRKMQRLLQRVVESLFGIRCGRPVNGEVAGNRRKELVDAFQRSPGFQVLIMSPEAAGVGLNVVAANHVIHLSREWNPAKEDQATDRIYRIGQSRPVWIHLPLAVHPVFDTDECRGSFDQKLHRLLDQKRQLSQNVLLPSVIGESEMQDFAEDIVFGAKLTVQSGNQVFALDQLDRIDGLAFERTVGRIFEHQGYRVELTPASNDYGADVVVFPQQEKEGFLIQCKHTSDPAVTMGRGGVQEVISAVGVYHRRYDCRFTPMVVTNALRFSDNACTAAESNGVVLATRKNLHRWISEQRISIAEIII